MQVEMRLLLCIHMLYIHLCVQNCGNVIKFNQVSNSDQSGSKPPKSTKDVLKYSYNTHMFAGLSLISGSLLS
jgi:hypothetical protein